VTSAQEIAELHQHYAILRDQAGYVRQSRDVVNIAGPDASEYLNGQLSQDIASLEPGEAVWTFLLQPTGKVEAYGRIFRASDEHFVLEVPAGWGDAIHRRLERFLLRVKCEISQDSWVLHSYRGAKLPADYQPESTQPEILKAQVQWGDVIGFDFLGRQLTLPADMPQCSPVALDILRVEAGIPQLGREILPEAIPSEIGTALLEEAVSFTKGCYVGQELVERMHSRGSGAPRRLLGVNVSDEIFCEAGSQLYGSNPQGVQELPKPQAQLTSLVCSPRFGYSGLVLAHRSVSPSDVLFTAAGAEAQICSLPFTNSNVS